jgi:hypothetical protein
MRLGDGATVRRYPAENIRPVELQMVAGFPNRRWRGPVQIAEEEKILRL